MLDLVFILFGLSSPVAAAATCDAKCESSRQECVSECKKTWIEPSKEEYAECVDDCGTARDKCKSSCDACVSDCSAKLGKCSSACPTDEDECQKCNDRCSDDNAECFEDCGVAPHRVICSTGGGA